MKLDSPAITKTHRIIGAELRALREKQGWSRPALAETVGISADALYRIEQARQSVSLMTLLRLADVLGAELDMLCGRSLRRSA